VELLTSCSSDTAYRLRYDTMQYDYISPAVIHLLGYSATELMDMNLRSLIIETRIVNDGMKTVDSYDSLEESRKRGKVQKWQADYLMRTRDGRTIWVSDISNPWFGKNGAIVGSTGSLRDITERIAAEERIRNESRRQDYTDELTGLANWRTFHIRLEEEIRRKKRTNDELSLMIAGVDGLDEVRTAYDRKMADEIMIAIAKLLRKHLRAVDIIARTAPENFCVMMPKTPPECVRTAAGRLLDAIAAERLLAHTPGSDNRPYTLSIGITGTQPGDNAIDAGILHKQADAQLYIARHKGKNEIAGGE
jgi:diguanylate cyclase (GGDEF)-like protein/PAS domain S-box-containing protein